MFKKNIAKMTRGTPLPSLPSPSPPPPLPSPPLPSPPLPSLPLVTQRIHSHFQPKQSPSIFAQRVFAYGGYHTRLARPTSIQNDTICNVNPV